uniref:Uncharacterized protein n=1 Tax=Arundo donax TaxID=35708 RepID=A0A0A8ZKB4_ARUDO
MAKPREFTEDLSAAEAEHGKALGVAKAEHAKAIGVAKAEQAEVLRLTVELQETKSEVEVVRAEVKVL